MKDLEADSRDGENILKGLGNHMKTINSLATGNSLDLSYGEKLGLVCLGNRDEILNKLCEMEVRDALSLENAAELGGNSLLKK